MAVLLDTNIGCHYKFLRVSMAIHFETVEAALPLNPKRLRSHFGSKLRTAAKAETTSYARACRRAFDSPQRCRLC